MIEKTGAPLPFSCEQMFDLAADIERYPEFLTGWISVRVLRRESNVVFAEQVIGLGPIHLQFSSQGVLQRPERIDVTSNDRPFRHFSLSWKVTPIAPTVSRISVATEFDLQSGFLQHVVNQFLPTAVDDIVAAFERRAYALYGGRNDTG